jgi:catechol 2,3-dioxygenase
MGTVALTITDLDRMRTFYEDAMGFRTLSATEDSIRLGVGERPLVELIHRPGASERPYGTTGLFHLAILVPDRKELARAIRRVVAAGWGFTGASDHLVSEAMYLDDPEGNGIEIYRDRPRAEWGVSNGELAMATLPLDVDGVLAELAGETNSLREVAAGTRMGHVHLNVADLVETEAFYVGTLGFDVIVRGYPGALFVSAGGYHHHLGLNTWAGRGAPPAPAGSRGLRAFDVVVPNEEELERIETRLESMVSDLSRDDRGLTVEDPSGNRVRLTL